MFSTGVQLYIVAAFVAGGLLPYLWRHRPAPPTWVWIVPGWLLGVAGWWITVFRQVIAVPVAVTGIVVLVATYRRLRPRLRGWAVSATVLSVAYAVFTFTPSRGDRACAVGLPPPRGLRSPSGAGGRVTEPPVLDREAIREALRRLGDRLA